MRQKFVVRLLTDEGALLSWAEVWAVPKPQDRRASCPFWPERPTQFVITEAGLANVITIHWCDLDVARKQVVMGGPIAVTPGQVFNFTWAEPVWLVGGMHDVPLPTITVGAQESIIIPSGNLSSIDPR